MEKPTYYAVLPAEIRYAKDLSNLQKLIYAELTALSAKNGFAFPSNQYLAKLYDKTETWISLTLTDMRKKGYIQIFVSSKDGNKRQIYLGGIKENLKTYLRKLKDPSLRKLKHNNTSINIKTNKDFSNEKSSLSEPKYEKVAKQTYKTKKQIATKKGIVLKTNKRTPRQKETFNALKWVNYYRDRAQEIHGMQFFKVQDDSRNKVVRKLIVRANKECNLKDLIDWWLDGAGYWASYEPEACFSTKAIERFLNTKPKKKYEPGKTYW